MAGGPLPAPLVRVPGVHVLPGGYPGGCTRAGYTPGTRPRLRLGLITNYILVIWDTKNGGRASGSHGEARRSRVES